MQRRAKLTERLTDISEKHEGIALILQPHHEHHLSQPEKKERLPCEVYLEPFTYPEKLYLIGPHPQLLSWQK